MDGLRRVREMRQMADMGGAHTVCTVTLATLYSKWCNKLLVRNSSIIVLLIMQASTRPQGKGKQFNYTQNNSFFPKEK